MIDWVACAAVIDFGASKLHDVDDSQPDTELTRDICAWLTSIVGTSGLRIDEESVIGGQGIRLSLGAYLSILEKTAAVCKINVADLLQLQPPFTVGALAAAAAAAAAQ